MTLLTDEPVIGEVTILTNQQSHLSELVDRMITDMDAAGLTLADMLAGLEEERQMLWQSVQDSKSL